MKFSRLSLSVAIGACAALACGGGDRSPTNGSQGDMEGSGTPNSTTGESSRDAGAAKGSAGTTTPSPTATSSTSPPSSPRTAQNSGDASAASTSSPSPTTGESSRDGGAAEDGAGVASSPSTTSATPVYFINDVYPILLAKCGTTCHASGDSANGSFTLGTSFPAINVWEELTTLTANHAAPDTTCDEDYVINQNPAGSLLYQKITGVGIPAGCGVQMPKGGPYLSAADQETIKNWILDDEILTH